MILFGATKVSNDGYMRTFKIPGRRNETLMSSSGEKTPLPAWELSLEPSVHTERKN